MNTAIPFAIELRNDRTEQGQRRHDQHAGGELEPGRHDPVRPPRSPRARSAASPRSRAISTYGDAHGRRAEEARDQQRGRGRSDGRRAAAAGRAPRRRAHVPSVRKIASTTPRKSVPNIAIPNRNAPANVCAIDARRRDDARDVMKRVPRPEPVEDEKRNREHAARRRTPCAAAPRAVRNRRSSTTAVTTSHRRRPST